jgi:hypothetical protein
MNYKPIDSIILAWSDRHGLSIFTGIEGRKTPIFRAVYISSDKETCQIFIDQPKKGKVILHARDIETYLDEEMQQDWSVSIDNLDTALEEALIFVRNWFGRKHP